MLCPHCQEDHAEGLEVCPNTGKPLDPKKIQQTKPPKGENKNRTVWIVVGVVAAILICACICVGGFFLLRQMDVALPFIDSPRPTETSQNENQSRDANDSNTQVDDETTEEAIVPEEEVPTEEPAVEEPAVEEPEEDCSSGRLLCIGLVTDVGTVDDSAFYQMAWEGALTAGETFDAYRVEYIESQNSSQFLPNIEIFVDDGYDIVITVGFGMIEATQIAAGKYPATYFIAVDQYQVNDLPNLVGLVFHEDQGGFLAGALAAMLTETGTIAGVYASDLVPPVVAFKEGFEAGAAYINPNIDVISTYYPGDLSTAFTDPEWGAAIAAEVIDMGADVVFTAAGPTGAGALIEAAGYNDVFCIGVDADQWLTIPEAHGCLVSSAMKLVGEGIYDIIGLYLDGAAPHGNYYGSVGMAPFHDFADVIDPDILIILNEIAEALEDGSISTGYSQ